MKFNPSLVFIFFYVFLFSSVNAQGFYNLREVFLNKSEILQNEICSVKAYDRSNIELDSSFHPLTMFVFEYKFDEQGYIMGKTYWYWSIEERRKYKKRTRFMHIALLQDTAIVNFKTKEILYKNLRSSEIVRFNQDKNRTKKRLNKIFNRISNSCWTSESFYSNEIVRNFDFSIDTTIFNKRIRLPSHLIIEGDSIHFSENQLITFSIEDGEHSINSIYRLEDNNKLKIDSYSEGKPWRIYYFNEKGLLEKEVQNDYTTYYLYDNNDLHVRTEEYSNGVLFGDTEFIYFKNCD